MSRGLPRQLTPAASRAAAALVVCCLLACAAGLWASRASFGASLVLPGATDVVVSSRSLMGGRLTYRARSEPAAWRDQIRQRLLPQGWRGVDYRFGTTRQFAVTWYTRETILGPLRLVESAVVGGDPDDPGAVIIEFQRELHLRSPLARP